MRSISMRLLMVFLLLVPLSFALGCGGRPDPRDNPNFDQESYDDVDKSVQKATDDLSSDVPK